MKSILTAPGLPAPRFALPSLAALAGAALTLAALRIAALTLAVLTVAALTLAALPQLAWAQAAPAASDTLRLDLDSAVSRALANGEEIRLAETDMSLARAAYLQARSTAFPQLNLSGTYTRQIESVFQMAEGPKVEAFDPDTTAPLEQRVRDIEKALPYSGLTGLSTLFSSTSFGSENSWIASAGLTQKVFQGGSIWSSIQAAKHAMEAARDMRTDQEQEVVLRTRQAYLGALLADRSVTIARLTYEQAETERQRVELRQGTGEASEFDLLQAQLQSENQIPVIKRAESFRVIAYLELRRLANIPPSQPMVLTSTVLASERVLDAAATVDTTGLVDDALRSASVRALQEQVEARRHAVTVAASDKWPELNLFANYSKQAFPSDVFPTASDEWLNDVNAGVRVNWALFDGFRTKGAIQESKARRIAAQLNLQQAREQVREAIVQSRGELDRAASDLRARTATVRVAERAHELARLRFEEGASSMIELNDARISLEIAQTNEAQARHDFFVALARLERYSGRPLFASLVSTIEGTR